ncbi:MAG: radical SAM protein [Candidatus Omnitrophica bacterium]|nr:radical SAM protein [Candidatus Omnitrophota bacterium]
MKKFKERPEEWGDFVDVKINACEVLRKQLERIKPPKEVFMSSVGDGWQPLEARYKLSRACLKLLLEAGFEVSILTKSSLIQRDFDVLTRFKTVCLGMTITTLDKELQKVLEPYASTVQERLDTLKKAQDKRIKTWVFLGPLIPEFTDTYSNLEAIFKAIKGLNLDSIYIDRLNLRWQVLEALRKSLSKQDYLKWRLLFYKCINPQRYAEYSQQLRKK